MEDITIPDPAPDTGTKREYANMLNEKVDVKKKKKKFTSIAQLKEHAKKMRVK